MLLNRCICNETFQIFIFHVYQISVVNCSFLTWVNEIHSACTSLVCFPWDEALKTLAEDIWALLLRRFCNGSCLCALPRNRLGVTPGPKFLKIWDQELVTLLRRFFCYAFVKNDLTGTTRFFNVRKWVVARVEQKFWKLCSYSPVPCPGNSP
jgi:hypothetical protein